MTYLKYFTLSVRIKTGKLVRIADKNRRIIRKPGPDKSVNMQKDLQIMKNI